MKKIEEEEEELQNRLMKGSSSLRSLMRLMQSINLTSRAKLGNIKLLLGLLYYTDVRPGLLNKRRKRL